jgi:WD40 repeat protein
MASDPPKVLISYSHDSPEHEKRVLTFTERLRGDGIDCTIDQHVVVPEEGWPLWMENQIQNSNFVLMICTETYCRRVVGQEESGKGLGVRWEGRLIYHSIYGAEMRNTKFIPVLFEAGDSSHIPGPVGDTNFYLVQTERGYEDLYRRLTNQPHTIKPELGKLRSLPAGEHKSDGACGRLVNVPNLPAHFLPRTGDIQALKDAMLAGGGKFGLQGMGGIGKTVLATALAHDPEVRQAFPDGIFWLTIGQKPNLLNLQNQLFRQLTGSKETLTTEQEAKDALREALEGRQALVVVDDAWTIDHADAFCVTEPPGRLLITTRNWEVLVGLGAEEHRLDLLSSSDALKILAAWVGQKSPDKLPVEAAEVARKCGYLPLALAMIGAMIRLRPTGWKDALGRLHNANLEAVKGSFPGYPYPDLLRAIEVSVDGLESADRERYRDLAVSPEDQPIPESMLSVLWQLDDIDTRDCMARLVARSLGTWGTGETSLILHDLQRDLIHKRREKELAGLHLRLVEAWNALPKLPDAYAWRWVGYHMMKAGRKDDLRQLLLSFNWLQAKLAATDTNALIADYDFLPEDKDSQLVQSAIRLSAHVLASDPRQLAAQLLGRLLGHRTIQIRSLLKQAKEWKTSHWLRPLKPTLTRPGGALIRTLIGHTDIITVLALLPDGRRLISGSEDCTLRVWDLESGKTLQMLEGHKSAISALGVTPDGLRVVSGSLNGTVRVWDLGSGRCTYTYETPTELEKRRGLGLEECLTEQHLGINIIFRPGVPDPHPDPITAVALMPCGYRAILVERILERSKYYPSDRSTLRVLDLRNGQTTYKRFGDSIVALAAGARHAVLGFADGTLKIWDLQSDQIVKILKGHDYSIAGLAVTRDGRHVISTAARLDLNLALRALYPGREWTRPLQVWDVESGQIRLTLLAEATKVATKVALDPDGQRGVSVQDRTLTIWDLNSGDIHSTCDGHSDFITAVAVTLDGRRVISASRDRTVRLWNISNRQKRVPKVRYRWKHHDEVAITLDGRHVVDRAGIRELKTDKILQRLQRDDALRDRILSGRRETVGYDVLVALTSSEHRVVLSTGSARTNSVVELWNLEDGRILRAIKDTAHRCIGAVAVTPDAHCAVTASADHALQIWDLQRERLEATFVEPLGERSWHGLISERMQTREVREALKRSGESNLIGTWWAWAVAVTPDGQSAITASADRTLRVWDLRRGQIVQTLELPNGRRMTAISFMPDERRVVSASYDQTLRVWDLQRGKEVAIFTAEAPILACTVAPDTPRITAIDESGRVHFLRLVEADKTESQMHEAKISLLSTSV